MVTTIGQDAVIRYVPEVTPGTFPTNPALKAFSQETSVSVIGLDKNGQEVRDIGNQNIVEMFSTKNVYRLKVEGTIYDAQRIIDFCARNADKTLKSWSIEFIPDQSATVKHYFRGTGWRVASREFSTADGESWSFSIEFKLGKITDPVTVDPGIGTGSRELTTAVAGPIKTFATAAVTLNAAAFAAIVGSFSVSIVDEIPDAKHTMGDAEPVTTMAIGGKRTVTGACDLSLDDGAATVWARVKAYAKHAIVVPFGASGAPMLTIANAQFPNLEAEMGTDVDLLMGGQDFQAPDCVAGLVP